MNLKTVYDKKEDEWHDHFLLIPRKVSSYPKEPEDYYIEVVKVQFLWLETVKRKRVNPGWGKRKWYWHAKW